jgi:hypothetical protein
LLVTAHSEPGSPDAPNEDGIVITADTVAVLDGATARTDTGCIHGVAWFVERLGQALAKFSDLAPAEMLAAAISATAEQHRDTCDLEYPGTPSAAVAIVQARGGAVRYLILGDVTLIVDDASGLQVLTDDRVSTTATAERAAADALPSGSAEKDRALVRMKNAELSSRNLPGGFWVAAADPGVVANALTGHFPARRVQRAAFLSDGAARAVDLLKLYDWPGLLAVLCAEGPAEFIRQVRAAENSDPDGARWPRNKIHDDATVALIRGAEFHAPHGMGGTPIVNIPK